MYFEAIIAKHQTCSEKKKVMLDLIINELSPKVDKEDFASLYTDELDIFSHWIYTAILALAEIPNFELSVKNIKEKLIEDLGEEQIEQSLFKLISNGCLVTLPDGKISRKYLRTSTKSDQKHKGAQDYYYLICDLAKKSVSLPFTQRESNSFSFPIDDKNIPIAKEIIRKCRNSLSKLSK